MNQHIINIVRNRDKNISLLENIINYIDNNKNEMDIYDMADIIKKDTTFMKILFIECKNKFMLNEVPNNTLSLTDLFT